MPKLRSNLSPMILTLKYLKHKKLKTFLYKKNFNKSNVVQRGLYSYRQRVCVITVVKMLWTHEAQPSESATNFDHCDDVYLSSIRVQTTLNHIRFVFYHNIKDNERNLCQDLLTTRT